MVTDLPFILTWWGLSFLIGVIFLPLTTLIFKIFYDKGYAFSKILGIILVSYFIWVLSSLHLLKFSTLNLFLILTIFLLINIFLTIKFNLLPKIRQIWRIAFFEEVLFLLGLIFWSFVRAHEPSIHGLEKFMDFGFINSILRSEYFPPRDIWLTPETINYYYFGHLVVAVLTKLTSVPAEISYNIMLASLFGLAFSAAFSIGLNLSFRILKRLSILVGLISALLLTLGGNIHSIYAFFSTYTPADNPVPFWQLQPMLNFAGYWYPNATRFIPNTIHEFPLYSFVVADLHGHVLNIPFALLVIAFFISVFYSQVVKIWHLSILGFLIAILLMGNFLDGPIYLLFNSLIIFFISLRNLKPKLAFWQTIKSISLVLLFIFLFSLPFWLHFKPFGSGIGVLCAPQFLVNLGRLGPFIFEADHCLRSPIWMLAILWGFFYSVLIGYLITIFKKAKEKLDLTDSLVIIFAVFATIAITIPEFLYVKDIYPAHYRANTVFKFGYQAFMALSLVSGYMIVRIITLAKLNIYSYFYFLFVALLFSLVSLYPYFAINSYYGKLSNYKGLDGLKYLNDSYSFDYQAIIWIGQNLKGQPVILEAQGDSYTDYARVSANTGLPTVIGWPVHEWLWRGSYSEPGKRVDEVTKIFEGTLDESKQLLQKYKVEYVFLGELEKQKYPNLKEENFSSLGNIIYDNGTTRIYRLN